MGESRRDPTERERRRKREIEKKERERKRRVDSVVSLTSLPPPAPCLEAKKELNKRENERRRHQSGGTGDHETFM